MEQKKILLRLRKEKGLSQTELAEELGIARQTVSRWEAGFAMPSAENLIGLSRVYGIPPEEILRGGAVKAETPEPDESAENESSADEDTLQKTGAGKQANQTRTHRWLYWFILLAVFCGGVLLCGKLTNSLVLAGGVVVFIVFLTLTACLLYGLHSAVTYFKKQKG